MARLPKLRPRIVFCVVGFIFLSVCASEQTRCYWCGPLAEQVHRSQRAPSCDGFQNAPHETVCDPGYSHCAVVAVAPPYTESRLCVKFYQDECYSLYCNSTKTWRMVCACRGDLCNGPHTARETQAFALLPKFTKTKPRKRNLISHFIGIKTRTQNEDNTVIILNKENDTIYNIQNDQPDENISILYTPTPKNADDNFIIVHGSLKKEEKLNHATITKEIEDSATKNDQISIENTKHENNTANKEMVEQGTIMHVNTTKIGKDPGNATTEIHAGNTMVVNNTDNAVKDKHTNNTNIDENLNNTKVDKHLDNNAQVTKPVNVSEMIKQQTEPITNISLKKPEDDIGENIETIKPTPAVETVKEIHNVVTTRASMETSEEMAVQSSATPAKMPPAEALQQNVTPTSTMEHTTKATTVDMHTESHIVETTTLPIQLNNPNKKNSGTQTGAHVIAVIISILMHSI